MYICVYIYIYVHVYTYIYIYTCIYTYIYIYTYTHTCNIYIYIYMYVCIHTYIYRHFHEQTRAATMSSRGMDLLTWRTTCCHRLDLSNSLQLYFPLFSLSLSVLRVSSPQREGRPRTEAVHFQRRRCNPQLSSISLLSLSLVLRPYLYLSPSLSISPYHHRTLSLPPLTLPPSVATQTW